jgi:hypothetical protein
VLEFFQDARPRGANKAAGRQQLLDLEQQWQQVVESYQFIESLERLLLDQRPLPPEVEMLPKDFPPE